LQAKNGIFMLFRWLSLLICLLSATHVAEAQSVSKFSRQHFVSEVLKQPITKLKRCAQKGYIVYQNALALMYMSGHLHLDQDKIKAFAWAHVALDQIEDTHNPKLITNQRKYIDFITDEMTKRDVLKGLHLAKTYERLWGKHWTKPPIMDFSRVSQDCQLDLTPSR